MSDSIQQKQYTTDINDDKRSVTVTTGDTRDDKIVWSQDNEKILVEWCDIAQCYKWLNFRCHCKLSTMHAWFTIPAIILSTVTGTASFAQSTLPPHVQAYAPAVIGTINLLVGILTTVQQYLKVSEKNEAHRVSSIAWDKFARNVRIELAKKPEERDKAGHFIKMCRQEFDRLMETSPSIDDKTVSEFKTKFKNKPGFDKVKKPDICDRIISAEETRNRWYENITYIDEDEFDDAGTIAIRNRDNFILEQQRILLEREDELLRHVAFQKKLDELKQQDIENVARQLREEEEEYNQCCQEFNTFINGYDEVYSRKPHEDEIRVNFKDKIEEASIKRFLASYTK